MGLDDPRFANHAEVCRDRLHGADRFRFEGLWIAGSCDALRGRAVAVVGSRAPSQGGRSRAHALGAALAGAGVCVVSGLAHGIDAAAHEGALAAAGPTVGVLGGGHRCFFPSRNRPLAQRIIASGGAVLSPYAPDEPARPAQFLQRNGVIAALADAVVIVEAAERSGALNTAGWAASLGLDVLAYPGDVDRPKAA
ncbi:MAG: DNA-protecting protein DprA, partial [Candidatus Eremiobacteraeota bacterium]|nr:DNA-protecting protein DprA [Candidatus Eremiobacteraeota bacterium]